MGSMTQLYTVHKKQVWLFFTILTIMISIHVFQSTANMGFSQATNLSVDNVDQAVSSTLGDSVELYAGIFSTSVTASINPTATLAVLSVLGTIENAQQYFPDAQWLVSAGGFLNKIPLVRTISGLPISNPVASVLFIIIAVGMYVLHSTSVTKMFSKATLDQIEQWGGFIVTVALSLLPLATTKVVAATNMAGSMNYVTAGTYAVTVVLAISSAIYTAVVYMCIYSCMDAVEMIGAVIPIKGMNIVIQLLKAALHAILIILQIFSPVLSIVFSLVLMLIGIILFRQLTTLSTYYNYIYIKPLWKNIWHKDDLVPMVHRKFPPKGRKLYPDIEVAVPVFSMNKIQKIKKRQLVWLVVKDQIPYISRICFGKKNIEIPLSALLPNQSGQLYLQKTFRFTRLLTEDKAVELIISNEYCNQWQQMLECLKVADFQLVTDRRKAAQAQARAQKDAQLREKREKLEVAWESSMSKLFSSGNQS